MGRYGNCLTEFWFGGFITSLQSAGHSKNGPVRSSFPHGVGAEDLKSFQLLIGGRTFIPSLDVKNYKKFFTGKEGREVLR